MKIKKLNVRLPTGLSCFKDGLDFAIWRAYVDESLLTNENLVENKALSSSTQIPLAGMSLNYLNEISVEMELSKSEIMRRCLVWLSKQATYPKFYK